MHGLYDAAWFGTGVCSHALCACLLQEWNPKEHKSTVAVSAGNKVCKPIAFVMN